MTGEEIRQQYGKLLQVAITDIGAIKYAREVLDLRHDATNSFSTEEAATEHLRNTPSRQIEDEFVECIKQLDRLAEIQTPPFDYKTFRAELVNGFSQPKPDTIQAIDGYRVQLRAWTSPTPDHTSPLKFNECAPTTNTTTNTPQLVELTMREYAKSKGLQGDAATRMIDRLEKRAIVRDGKLNPCRPGSPASQGKAAIAAKFTRDYLDILSGESKDSGEHRLT
jgi:hypothetical protein